MQWIGTDKTGTRQSGTAGGQAGLIMFADPASGLFYPRNSAQGPRRTLARQSAA